MFTTDQPRFAKIQMAVLTKCVNEVHVSKGVRVLPAETVRPFRVSLSSPLQVATASGERTT